MKKKKQIFCICNEENEEPLKKQLSNESFELFFFVDNEDYIKALNTVQPDLIIVNSPDDKINSCIDIVLEIDKNIKTSIPIFAIVDTVTDEEKSIAKQVGISEIFLMPIEEVVVFKFIEDMFYEKPQEVYALIIDDNEDERKIIQYIMREMKINMLEACDGEDAKKHLYDDRISIIICDIYMPKIDGYETCKMFKSRETFKHVPFIALTSSEKSSDLKRMLDVGAIDFIRKPFLFEEFIARVKAHLRFKDYFYELQQHISEEERLNIKLLEVNNQIKELNEKLEDMAITDYLTGIYNRRYVLEYLINEIERCKRYDDTFAIAIFDIDHFKNFNDTYGHLLGDRVLEHMCNLIVENTRKSDLFGRYGGEEFILIMHNAHIEEGIAHSEKLRSMIEGEPLMHEGKLLKVTTSCGVAQYKTEDSMDEIINRADQALFRAKKNGRNRVESA